MLRNWPIRSKLVVILIIPLLTLAVLSAISVRGNLSNVAQSNRVRGLAAFSVNVSSLVAAVGDERTAMATFTGSNYSVGAASAASARPRTDQAIASYRSAVASLPGDSRDRLRTTLAAVDQHLSLIPGQRKLVDQRTAASLKSSALYTQVIAAALSLDAQVSTGSKDADLIGGAATLMAIAQAEEATHQEVGAVSTILFLRTATAAVAGPIGPATGAKEAWITQFRNSATPAQRELYDRTAASADAQLNALDGKVLNEVQTGQRVDVDPGRFLVVSAGVVAKTRAVEARVAADLRSKSTALATSATHRAWLSGLATLLVLALSVGISLLVASPMIRQLRRLRVSALEVANDRLPSLVERLHQGRPVDVEAEIFPISGRTRDEIGQVADAFSIVHQVAVRTAVEQAAMRKSIGDTFLNLARRSQSLVHRQLKVIDKLERKETDPDELEDLFRLDHLATRMRRHAEDLIVLSGSKPARGWRRPVALKDVVRGAVAEVEDYTRVKVLPVSGPPVSGHAVGDIIHLLAELVENATSFSPPHTPVHIWGHEVSKGCVVEIEDRGLGMTEQEFDEINARLSDPPPFDLSTSERLGLFVVGRLADRHGVRVRLRQSPYGGTLAIILLPNSLLRPSDPNVIDVEDDAVAIPEALVAAGAQGSRPAHHLDRPLTDDLPVLATARSSWFVNERNGHGPADPLAGAPSARSGSGRSGPAQYGPGQSGPISLPPAPSARATDPGPAEPRTTEIGLPKRQRRAHLAPELRAPGPLGAPAPRADDDTSSPLLGSRSPEEIRTMMTSFQSNFGRGLQDGPFSNEPFTNGGHLNGGHATGDYANGRFPDDTDDPGEHV